MRYPVTRVSERLPAGLVEAHLPPGVSLEKFVKQETARLQERYPEPKDIAAELGPELRAMYEQGRYQRNLWDTRYELVKLRIREELGAAKTGMADGMPFVVRRQFPVASYTVDSYDQDALYPA